MKKAACFLKYIVLLLLYFFLMDHFRSVLMAVLIVLLVYDIRKKYKWRIVLGVCVILTAFAANLTHYPLYKEIDRIRFSVLEGVYRKAAEGILKEQEKLEEGYWHPYPAGGLFFLTAEGKVFYLKEEEHIAVVFPTDAYFVTGYVYCSDAESREMLEKLAGYGPDSAKGSDTYEYYQRLSEDWSYIHFY